MGCGAGAADAVVRPFGLGGWGEWEAIASGRGDFEAADERDARGERLSWASRNMILVGLTWSGSTSTLPLVTVYGGGSGWSSRSRVRSTVSGWGGAGDPWLRR